MDTVPGNDIPSTGAASTHHAWAVTHAWDQTPLGGRDTWPASLRVAVDLCAISSIPMLVLWGQEHLAVYNAAFAAITDPATGEQGRPLAEVFPTVHKALKPAAEQVRATGVESRIHAPAQGNDLSFSYTLVPLAEADGAIRGVAVIARLLTGAKGGAQQQHLMLLALALRGANIGAWFWDRQAKTFLWSPETYRLHGLDPSIPLTLEAINSAILPEDREQAAEAFERTEKDRTPEWAAEYRVNRPDKGIRWIRTLGQSTFTREGGIMETVGVSMDITEQKQTEEALATSERRFRTLADHAPILIGITDMAGALVYVNKAWLDFTGLTLEAALGTGWIRAMHPDDLPGLMAARAPARERGEPYPMEFRLRRGDGEFRWMMGTGAPYKGDQGETLGYIGTVIDVTETKRVEEALRESEERFRDLADSAPVMIAVVDAQGAPTYLNKLYYEYTGLTPEEALGPSRPDIVHPDDAESVRAATVKAFSTPSPAHLEYRIRHKDGSYRWIMATGLPRYSGSGEFLGYTAIGMDIEDRKRVEEALRESEERFRTLADNTPILISLFSPSNVLVYLNRAWYNLTGVPYQDVPYDGIMTPYIHPDDLERMQRERREAIAQGAGYHTEFRIRRHDGEYRWMAGTRTPFRDAKGEPLGYIGSFVDVTDRKAAEDRFRLTVEAAPNAMVLVNTAGKIALVNSQVEMLFGYRREELLGQDIEVLVPERFRTNHVALRQAFLGSLRARFMGAGRELYGLTKDGREVPIEIGLNPVETTEGTLVLAAINDITDRKRAEQATAQWAERQRALADLGQAALAEPDLQQLLTWTAEVASQTLDTELFNVLELLPDGKDLLLRAGVGWREGVVGQATVKAGLDTQAGYTLLSKTPVVVDDMRAERRFSGSALLSGHAVTSGMSCIITGAGGKPWGILGAYSVQRRRFPEEDVHFLQAVANILSSAIHRTQAEQALAARARQQRAVAELGQQALAEQDLFALFTSAATAVAQTLDVEYCKVLEVLPNGKEVLLRAGAGWREGHVGQARESSGLASQAGYALLSNKPVVVEDLRAETRFRAPKLLTEHGVVSGMSCVITGAGGKPWGVLGAHSTMKRYFTPDDINFLQAVANVLGGAIQRNNVERSLRDTDRRKDEFLATLSHELRNPLAAMRSATDVMGMMNIADPEVQSLRDIIDHQGQSLTRLVDDLLDVSRVMRGKIVLQRAYIDLATVVQRAVETTQPMIAARGHTLHVHMPTDPVLVDGDLTRLSQVVGNLLNNAAKYTPNNGTIWVTVESTTASAIVRVRDTGAGIPADLMPVLFDPFVQGGTHVERVEGGLGIGLTLVRSLTEMHGGTVQAFSEGPGMGSEFVITLSRIRVGTPDGAPLSPKGGVRGKGRSLRVLVIDDNTMVGHSMAALLRFLGHEVQTATDGLSGIDNAKEFKPQVVLVDIAMPGINGYETARRLRELPDMRNAVLIAVTGYGLEQDRRQSREAGFNDHLVKPVEMKTLLHALESVPS